MKRLIRFVMVAAVVVCNGCASIVSESRWPVTINSNPSGAAVLIKDKRGMEVQKATTPTTILLPSGAGFFQPAAYTFTFEKIGFEDRSASLSADLNPWYIGNIIIGGLIGFLIVDPVTGAMWKLDPLVTLDMPQSPSPPVPTQETKAVEESSSTTKADDVATKLIKLKGLKEAGQISEDEYQSQRKSLLEQL